MASKHIVVWPKVRVTVNGKSKIVDQGELVPAGVSDVDLSNLVSFGAIAGVTGVAEDSSSSTGTAPAEGAKSDKIDDILKDVGDDKEKAAAALEVEKAKGEDARKTLVAKLEAIANPAPPA